jgi:hypothetical protein
LPIISAISSKSRLFKKLACDDHKFPQSFPQDLWISLFLNFLQEIRESGSYGKEQTGSFQRRRSRNHHYDYGLGIESAAWNSVGCFETVAAGFLELCSTW